MKILRILLSLFFIMFMFLFLLVRPCLCNFTSFVFGDSLVDAGNNNYLVSLSKSASPPYGIDFKPSGGRPTGRFTNARTISDIIGFENVDDPCCGGYFLSSIVCVKGISNNANTSSVFCENRTKYVFWDAYHPTEVANLIISRTLLINGDQSLISPINIRLLYTYNLH